MLVQYLVRRYESRIETCLVPVVGVGGDLHSVSLVRGSADDARFLLVLV